MQGMRFTAALAALSAITLGLPAAAQDPTFGGDELKQAWTDKELMGRSRNGLTFHISFIAGGGATFSSANLSDTGEWRAVDTGYCTKWQRIREGKEGCFVVRRNDSNYIVYNENGSESGRIHNVH